LKGPISGKDRVSGDRGKPQSGREEQRKSRVNRVREESARKEEPGKMSKRTIPNSTVSHRAKKKKKGEDERSSKDPRREKKMTRLGTALTYTRHGNGNDHIWPTKQAESSQLRCRHWPGRIIPAQEERATWTD